MREKKEKEMDTTICFVEARTCNKLTAWFTIRKWKKQGRQCVKIPISPCRALFGVVVCKRTR